MTTTYIKEETLGQRIRAQRIRLGMTQEELAEEMCTTKSMISYYENDHGDMKQSMIAEFAVILGTTDESSGKCKKVMLNPMDRQKD